MASRLSLSVLLLLCGGILCTVRSAPVETRTPRGPETRTPRDPDSRRSHVRSRRCSCRSFLDKECVYFCHLDILWVNSPERLVSYGLGSAPRSRRSLPPGPQEPSHRPRRCHCHRQNDHRCGSFCRLRPLEQWRRRQRRRSRSRGGSIS